MNEAALLQNSLLVGAALFCIGLIGFLCRRNMIVMFLCAEMMLQGVSVSLVAWGRWHNNWDGQALVIFILTVAACEAAIALALFLMMFQRRDNLDIAAWDDLREANLPAHVDHELPAVVEPFHHWPILTPSGLEPKEDEEEATHRSHV
jgi:NADH-quinone oxidoreductase subunit K